nr:uncharacterized protein si:ch73-70k4.1 [Misgurnus anguillicaudatus]
MSKLKRKKSAVDYRPEQQPVSKKTNESLCRVQESHCSKTLKDSSAAEVVSWWERSELSDVERIWALTLKALCPSLQTHQEECIPQLPPPSSTLLQRTPVDKESDWKWSSPDENITELPDLPAPSFLIHQHRVINPTSHHPAVKDNVESEPGETNQTTNRENSDVSNNQEGVSICDLQTMQHRRIDVHALLNKTSDTCGPAGQVFEQFGTISEAGGSGSGLKTKSGAGGSELGTKSGAGGSGSGLKTKTGPGGPGSELGTISGAGGSGSGLKTKSGAGGSGSELGTKSGAGGSGSGLKTKSGAGESGSELQTKSGAGGSGSGLKTKSGAGGSGSELGTKSGAGGSRSELQTKSGAGGSGSGLKTNSGAGGFELGRKSGAGGSGTGLKTKSGAGGSGTGPKTKLAAGGSKSLFGTKSAGAGSMGSMFSTKSGSGLSLEKPGAGKSQLELECCPMCLMPFPAGFSQMECDGHLAQCLSEMNADIVW